MKIQLSNQNSEAIIKDIYSRKIAKEVNKILFKEVETQGNVEDKKVKQSITGFKMNAMEEANDYVLLQMIEKLILDGKEVAVSMEVLDEMSVVDFNSIKTAIDKLSGVETEKKN